MRPGLATTGGPLIIASSPYAKRGVLYETHKRHYGNHGDPLILVAQGTSREFNPSLAQSVVDRALERDHAAASAEYLAEFRSDIESFVSREAVEACITLGVRERAPLPDIRYTPSRILPAAVPTVSHWRSVTARMSLLLLTPCARCGRRFHLRMLSASFARCSRAIASRPFRATNMPVFGRLSSLRGMRSSTSHPRSPRASFTKPSCPGSILAPLICSTTRAPSRSYVRWSAVLRGAAATASTTHRARTMILLMPSRVCRRDARHC